jgi:hypothetical protein
MSRETTRGDANPWEAIHANRRRIRRGVTSRVVLHNESIFMAWTMKEALGHPAAFRAPILDRSRGCG